MTEQDDIPDDFPRGAFSAVVSGHGPKVCARLSGEVYRADPTEEELYERWALCADLAEQLVDVARKDLVAHPELTSLQVLERVGRAVKAKNWVASDELEWLIRHLRMRLRW
ncbi:hypothetical protein G5S35_14270 [Paraburkholderia tropica]|uniref:hypothetical protein n=1 Tax=Paraburkholderia tropica TaxID=92647 RepID=UPI001601E70D|nr:hypothetical protein [Paraburkholderia tropica]QNB12623.1 hypothetical protein G5S35_14270 [Paraburkholderia tropica]